MGANDTEIPGKFLDWGGSGWRNVRHTLAGVMSDGTTDDAVAWAALNATWGYQVPQGVSYIASDITMAHAAMSFAPGAVLKLAAGVQVHIAGTVIAGPWQIFDLSAGGGCRVTFADGKTSAFMPEWWGAAADEVTDSIDAFDEWAIALGSESGSRGRKGVLMDGVYRVSRNLLIDNVRGLTVTGAGITGSTIRWIGNSTDDVVRLQSCMDCLLEDFAVENDTGFTVKAGFRIIQGASGFASSRNTLRHVQVGARDDGVEICFIVGGAGVDANNDFTLFDRCVAENYTVAGAQVDNSQVFDTTFRDCYFRGTSTSYSAVGLLHSGGNYRWIGGFMGLHTVDFLSDGDPNGGTFRIEDLDSEGSQRFVVTGGPSGGLFPLVIKNVRWTSGSLHADGIAIDFRFLGPLTIEGGFIGNDPAKALKIIYNPSGAYPETNFVVRDTIVATSLTTMTTIFTATRPTAWDFRVNGASWLRMRDSFSATQSIDIGSVAAGTTLQEVYTVPGVEFGDDVSVMNVSAALPSGLTKAWERAETTDQIRVGWFNGTGSPIDPTSIDIRVFVRKIRD